MIKLYLNSTHCFSENSNEDQQCVWTQRYSEAPAGILGNHFHSQDSVSVLASSCVCSELFYHHHHLPQRCCFISLLNERGPEDQLLSHSQESQHSFSASELRQPPACVLGFSTMLHFLVREKKVLLFHPYPLIHDTNDMTMKWIRKVKAALSFSTLCCLWSELQQKIW